MGLTRFASGLDPIDRLLALQRDLDRAFRNPMGFDLGMSGRGLFPPVNVFWDRDGACVVHVEIPGVQADSLSIQTQGRTLTLSGERTVHAPEGASFHRRERPSGPFSRSLQLPEDLDTNKAEAAYKNGTLTIRLTKKGRGQDSHDHRAGQVRGREHVTGIGRQREERIGGCRGNACRPLVRLGHRRVRDQRCVVVMGRYGGRRRELRRSELERRCVVDRRPSVA
ncbi:MAG: Hsp20/alpha crystallin family protein [Deltaproteobacteria bacterium]|nr:Hsp20/alpha crystallin family protein [Deltaproteobacteria bacterium]